MPRRITSVIVTPASSYDLTDLATVKDELSIPASDTSKDAFLARAITQVSASVANYCNRSFPAETFLDTVYPDRALGGYSAGTDMQPMQLAHYPIISVASVTVQDQGFIPGASPSTALTAAQYAIEAPVGWLIRLSDTNGLPVQWAPYITAVQYQAGFATIPADLVEAALRLVTMRHHLRGRDPTLRSQSQPGLGDQQYWVGSVSGAKGPFPDDILAILDQFAVPVIA